jgi:3-deoxy-7-phosphoheptulonate synthase
LNLTEAFQAFKLLSQDQELLSSQIAAFLTAIHLPVVVDPSHAAGQRDLVPSLAKGGIAVGADGLIIEVHPEPERALSDGAQSLTPPMFSQLMKELHSVAEAVGRKL